ncbi:MAG: glycosyltransferase [Lachnospiraceae bacterium]|jgi:glycosyltransferase involved in cell wall biosynthesis|nr:glycosyltransferase [Lachnospiraceae bacterium]
MAKLLLATENFPYDSGEKSFILPELKRLTEKYEVTIISHAEKERTAGGIQMELPKGVQVVCHPRPVLTGADKINALCHLVLDRDGRQEIREILRLKKNSRERLYQSLAFLAQSLADQRMLKKSGLLSEEDIIYYSFWYDYFCYSMIREKRRYPRICVLTRTHGHDLYHERIPGERQPFRHQMEEGLEDIVFACEYGRKYYADHVRGVTLETDKLQVCRLGTEPAFRYMPVSTDAEWQLLSCSNVIALKRVEKIIDSLALLEDIQIHWTHIGGGESLEAVKKYAQDRLDARANIRYTFTGAIDTVDQYYRDNQVDCFITTSSTEGGCPVSIQEAMSYGVPIIGTDVGGITEMIAGNGILLSQDPDAQETAEAIRFVYDLCDNKLQEMKQNSLHIWQNMFDIEKCYRKMMSLLQRCRETADMRNHNEDAKAEDEK